MSPPLFAQLLARAAPAFCGVECAVAGVLVGGALDVVVPARDSEAASEQDDGDEQQQDERTEHCEDDDHLVCRQAPQHRHWTVRAAAALSRRVRRSAPQHRRSLSLTRL